MYVCVRACVVVCVCVCVMVYCVTDMYLCKILQIIIVYHATNDITSKQPV